MKKILAVLLLSSVPAFAGDFYFTAGFGTSRLKTDQVDDLWQQKGFAHIEEEHSNAWKIGAGYKINKYLSFEADYRDLGSFSQQTLSVSDLGGPGSYNTQTGHCNGACEATSQSMQFGKTKGIGLSFVAAPDWSIAPFVRAGVFYHKSSFYSAQKYGSVPSQTQFVTYTYNEEGKDKEEFSSKGFKPMYGVGVRAGWLELEYTKYPSIGAKDGPYKDGSTLMLNIRHDF